MHLSGFNKTYINIFIYHIFYIYFMRQYNTYQNIFEYILQYVYMYIIRKEVPLLQDGLRPLPLLPPQVLELTPHGAKSAIPLRPGLK